MTRIYKLLSHAEWEGARAKGVFEGSAADLADGFIHFSTAAQAGETAHRYFAGQSGLVIVGFEAAVFGEALKWEPSRGGDLFPHLYRTLITGLAVDIRPVPLDADGAPVLGDLIP